MKRLFLTICIYSNARHGIGIPRRTVDELFAADSEYTIANEGILIYTNAVASVLNQAGVKS